MKRKQAPSPAALHRLCRQSSRIKPPIAIDSRRAIEAGIAACKERQPVSCARLSASMASTSLRVTARSGPASAARYRFVARLGSPAC